MFADALTDRVTISTITLSVNSSSGQEEETATPLYNSVSCRLMVPSRLKRFDEDQGDARSYKDIPFILMEPQYNGASRGDLAVIDGQNYKITSKKIFRGRTTVDHHVRYSLQEVNDPVA